jgi:hypothetical protein
MRSARPFGDRGLADAGFADQRGVVLGAAGKDLDGAADFLVAADHRIELAVARGLGQVAGVLLHRVIGVFGAGAVGRAAAGQFLIAASSALGSTPARLQRLPGRIGGGERQACSIRCDRNEAVAGLGGHLLGLVEHAHASFSSPGAACAPPPETAGILASALSTSARRSAGIAARALDQAGGHAFVVLKQRLQHMFGRDPLVVHADRDGLRALEESPWRGR